MNYSIRILCATGLLVISSRSYSQDCGSLNIQLRSEIPSSCTEMTMTMRQDNIGRPYLYVAQKEGGLKIYDISAPSSPQLVQGIPITALDSLHVMNVSQNGNYLYLALGNSFSKSQNPGMAIIDITDPVHPLVTDVYKYPVPSGGASIVKADGNYAYLGAMTNGLVILDISDKHKIKFVSKFLPDRNFPTAKPDTAKYNARGMEVRDGFVYLCFDAGGFRIIDISNKLEPHEAGRYSNPEMNGRPRAYNNVVLKDSLAFVAVDYCGMEILNISDPANIRLLSWWNPWNCTGGLNNWFTSDGHANEIDINPQCNKIFLSTGKSDMYVVDVSNPLSPDSCEAYGGVANNIGTWGISTFRDNIYLSYICTLGIPFASNWTGVKILTYSPCAADIPVEKPEAVALFPNPCSQRITVVDKNISSAIGSAHFEIENLLGMRFQAPILAAGPTSVAFDISTLPEGNYRLRLNNGNGAWSAKFIKSSIK
ncbi:MAG: T9SS type A sorting domain-containing protein [Bacteroidota bacterium]|nr:T9SS type A sorting domain-containing protein [Bacteroidota bacterium]